MYHVPKRNDPARLDTWQLYIRWKKHSWKGLRNLFLCWVRKKTTMTTLHKTFFPYSPGVARLPPRKLTCPQRDHFKKGNFMFKTWIFKGIKGYLVAFCGEVRAVHVTKWLRSPWCTCRNAMDFGHLGSSWDYPSSRRTWLLGEVPLRPPLTGRMG